MNVTVCLPDRLGQWTEDRTIKAVDCWLRQHIGQGTWLTRFEKGYHVWQGRYDHHTQSVEIRFEDPRKAVLFKLIWGGV